MDKMERGEDTMTIDGNGEGCRVEIIDHTADFGFILQGAPDTATLFSCAAKTFFDQIGKWADRKEGQLEEEGIQLEAEDLEELLHDFLSDLNFRHQARSRVYQRFSLKIDPPALLNGKIYGREITGDDEIELEVKAVTYHMLEVTREEDGYHAQILFDI